MYSILLYRFKVEMQKEAENKKIGIFRLACREKKAKKLNCWHWKLQKTNLGELKLA